MSGIKVYSARLNAIQLSKGITVSEFKSWIVSTLGSTSNDFYQSVVQTTDGGYVAVGYQYSQGQGRYDALIVKYDSNLNLVTQKGLGGSENDYYYSVTQTSDGGYVAVGYQNSQGQGNRDALIVKYDSNLDITAQAGIGGSGNDYFETVVQSTDGGFVAAGYSYTDSLGSKDALIVKYDSNLNVVTRKGLGDDILDEFYSITQSHSGGYVVVGQQRSQGQGNFDGLIVEYDSNLNFVRQRGLGGGSNDHYRSVILSNDGGYVVVGYQQSQGQGNYDALIVKYDSNLNVVTQKGLGGLNADYFESVVQSSDGGYVVVGYQYSQTQGQSSFDALIVKYDSDLNVVSQKGLGGSIGDRFSSLCQTNDGGFVAVGDQDSQGQGINDALIVKLPSDFDLITGSLTNHTGLEWTTPVLVETTLTLVSTTPTLTTTTPSLTSTAPSLTATTPTLVHTRSEKQ